MSEFKKNLMAYASKWVGKIAVPTIMRADELERDRTLGYLVNEWARYSDDHKRAQESVFNRLTDESLFKNIYGDVDEAITSYDTDYWGEKAGELSLIIRDILRDVYSID